MPKEHGVTLSMQMYIVNPSRPGTSALTHVNEAKNVCC